MKKLLFLLVVIFLLIAVSATARKKEPIPVYIVKPPINRPRTISVADQNRLYALNNPRHHVPSKEMLEYLKTRKVEQEENNIAEGNTDEQTWDEILDN